MIFWTNLATIRERPISVNQQATSVPGVGRGGRRVTELLQSRATETGELMS